MLQPKDEHVLYNVEGCASQFKHGVNFKLHDFGNKGNTSFVISVCFRQSRVSKKYLIDSEGNKVKNDNCTESMIERDSLISKKSSEMADMTTILGLTNLKNGTKRNMKESWKEFFIRKKEFFIRKKESQKRKNLKKEYQERILRKNLKKEY